MLLTTALQPYPRPQLSELYQVKVEDLIKRVPPLLIEISAIKVQLENSRLVKLALELRAKRSLVPLKDDADFQKCWDAIEAAIQLRQNKSALRFVLRENMRLTREIHEHQTALGLPLMKVHKV